MDANDQAAQRAVDFAKDWAVKLKPAALAWWALPEGGGKTGHIDKHAAAIATQAQRQQRTPLIQLWVAGLAAAAAWGSAIAAIVLLGKRCV